MDLSSVGKGGGMKKGAGTRSGLLWEVERILNELPPEELPDLLVMENVPQVATGANAADFNSWLAALQRLGYTSYYNVLNAQDYGVPQNRARAFLLSFLDAVYFDFPKKIPLEKELKDCLEESPAEKFYLTAERSEKIVEQLFAAGELK